MLLSGGGLDARSDEFVVEPVRLVAGLELGLPNPLDLAVADDDSAGSLGPVSPDDRDHRAEVGAEVHRQPLVALDRLPVTRSPGVVAQAEALDLDAFVPDVA